MMKERHRQELQQLEQDFKQQVQGPPCFVTRRTHAALFQVLQLEKEHEMSLLSHPGLAPPTAPLLPSAAGSDGSSSDDGALAAQVICNQTLHVTRHTSHVTRHTSHVTRHTRLSLSRTARPYTWAIAPCCSICFPTTPAWQRRRLQPTRAARGRTSQPPPLRPYSSTRRRPLLPRARAAQQQGRGCTATQGGRPQAGRS